MKKYNTIFFDLDHTLWDFEVNSHEALAELFRIHALESKGVSDVAEFIKEYQLINHQMWDEYHRNVITKETLRFGRFSNTLKKFNIEDDVLSECLADQYLEICPVKKNLFPHTIPVLDYLQQHYNLHIITNGFKEVQHLKIRNSGIEKYFHHVHISEEIGFKKPDPEIFHYAVKQGNTSHEKCLMIGDNLDTDIAGAKNAGIDHLLFNPNHDKVPDTLAKSIHSLADLLDML